MPKIIKSAQQFEQIKEKAIEARIVRSDNAVKIKLRTPKYLYTYTTNPDEAEDLIKGIKDLEPIDYSPVKKEEKDSDRKKKSKEDSEKEASS